MSSLAGPSNSLPPKPPKSDVARSHHAHTSIRAQTAKQKLQKQDGDGRRTGSGKQGQTNKQQDKGKAKAIEDPLGSREVVKPVLANPLMPRWPEIALQHQQSILGLLCNSLPGLQAYHISRDRCNRKRKDDNRNRAERERRNVTRAAEVHEEEAAHEMQDVRVEPGAEASGTGGFAGLDDTVASGKTKRKADEALADEVTSPATKKARKDGPPPVRDPPQSPEILQHMVIGINEVMKQMEKQMMALKDEFYAGEALGESVSEGAEPRTELNGGTSITAGINGTVSTKTYIRVIFVCLPDVNPRHLVEPIPQYCTSWNSLVSQCRNKLQKIIRGKTKEELKGRKDVMAMTNAVKNAMEVLLVPLPEGAEFELAKATGLRRVAVMALTATFPDLTSMLQLLLKASLKPLTPPFPLHPSASTATLPYAPIHLKAISTTMPVDAKAKKAARLLETREKRREATEKRKNQNEMWTRKGKLIKHGLPAEIPRKRGKPLRPPVFTEVDGIAEYVGGINVQM